MHHHYGDITERIRADPSFWDEHAVPRYADFAPQHVANIYADECCLLLIACQDCGTEFKVAFSQSVMDRSLDAMQKLIIGDKIAAPSSDQYEAATEEMRLSTQILTNRIHYGDPPNTGCCMAGATMNSVPLRVLEFWEQRSNERNWPEWMRVPNLEREIKPDWVKEQ